VDGCLASAATHKSWPCLRQPDLDWFQLLDHAGEIADVDEFDLDVVFSDEEDGLVIIQVIRDLNRKEVIVTDRFAHSANLCVYVFPQRSVQPRPRFALSAGSVRRQNRAQAGWELAGPRWKCNGVFGGSSPFRRGAALPIFLGPCAIAASALEHAERAAVLGIEHG